GWRGSCSPTSCPRSRRAGSRRASRPDRLQRGQSVVGALAGSHDAPELVVAEAVAAVEVADAVGAVIGGRQPGGPFLPGPRGAVAGPDRQRPELVKREAPAREMRRHILDPVQLGLPAPARRPLHLPPPLPRAAAP